ncbi:alkanesulfonate monooxygenase SsuD/methylene tetrahydromethanopterin reductase-like flavin-dependent oxidoreductase (luciferase family) [Kribbella sp. VKM Ac-2527]|uniref:Alkanesulfonate monooxygenase SsuD/methylene tetrahydromethanopterin reductase-like flavin-dependent oxidoreductase (Luciferase family) n=1 Tax=Kribbella caucasensis TaxID=2512215 RepID=A0A4R6J8C2_9ACTN|nr:LLM class flavin-dependent oxidoreductase [Kribbella sp. VKM Ac-2527]TDO30636.1 alkanesulfonate monooxygenase SsuD/methylene tetrahydromethanopterin reductase-like flavin-dependent oxidoreductase (luciferase family) [Kribbella sp. VKM Ac-2527]
MSTTTPILLELAVGRLVDDVGRGPDAPLVTSLTDAVRIAQVAEAAGVAGLRLLDAAPGFAVLDPTVVVSFLAGGTSALGYLADVPTTHHAPYNLARRILSIDRATGGRAGLVLRPGEGDEVTIAVVPDPSARDPRQRWCEYAEILRRLWDSFPAEALVGDQHSAIFVRDELIRPAGFDGRFYRVSGPLDGPSSVQGRPVQVAAVTDAAEIACVVGHADAVVVDVAAAPLADAALTAELERVERTRAEVALLGRIQVPPAVDADWLYGRVATQSLDGLVLTVNGSTHELLALIENTVSRLVAPRPTGTLREALGLSPVAVRTADQRESVA